MKKIFYFLCFALIPLMLGSARLDSINTHYLRVDETDKIDIDEAKIIAKKELLNLGQHYYYRLTAPHVIVDARTKKYPGLWFVSFDPKAISKTVYGNFLVVLDKETGKVLFAIAYDPRRTDNFDWIVKNDRDAIARPAR